MTYAQKCLLAGASVAILAIVAFTVLVEVHTVHGNEMAVLETWGEGIDERVHPPKTYVKFPGFLYNYYNYDMSSQVYVMNDIAGSAEFAQGRENDSYQVQSKEGQDMQISMNVRWRLDPEKLIHVHKTVRVDFEEKILRPALLRTVKDQATIMEAIEAYSGEGLVRLQTAIQDVLIDLEGDVRRSGIIVENFVIEGIKLDSEYIGQIKARQVAIQAELRAKQEEHAQLAEAQKAKAEAQVDYERQIVAAKRDKQRGILKAEKEKQERVLAAEAAKMELVLAAEGEKESGILRAQAIVAIGDAEAHAKEVNLMAYAVEGADNFVKIEIAQAVAEAFKNIDGYLPGDMNITMLTGSFMDSLDTMMGGRSSNMLPSTTRARGGN